MIQGTVRGDNETESSADANLYRRTPFALPSFKVTLRIPPSWEVAPRRSRSSYFFPNSWLISGRRSVDGGLGSCVSVQPPHKAQVARVYFAVDLVLSRVRLEEPSGPVPSLGTFGNA